MWAHFIVYLFHRRGHLGVRAAKKTVAIEIKMFKADALVWPPQ